MNYPKVYNYIKCFKLKHSGKKHWINLESPCLGDCIGKYILLHARLGGQYVKQYSLLSINAPVVLRGEMAIMDFYQFTSSTPIGSVTSIDGTQRWCNLALVCIRQVSNSVPQFCLHPALIQKHCSATVNAITRVHCLWVPSLDMTDPVDVPDANW